MYTVRDLRDRAKADLRRRIYERGLFRPARLKRLAYRLAGAYAAGLSKGDLMALARHESWLDTGKREDAGQTADRLFCFLRRELRRLAQSFWEGHVSVELAVQTSRVELVGFFNGERPHVHTSPNTHINTAYSDAARSGSFEGTPQNQQAPYA
jgi:hypothetical protein